MEFSRLLHKARSAHIGRIASAGNDHLLRALLFSALAGLTLAPKIALAMETLPVIDIHVQTLNPDDDDIDAPRVDDRSTEFVRVLMTEAGLEYQFHVAPLARNMQLLKNRPNVLVYPASRISEREKDAYWIGMVRSLDLSLVGLRGRLAELPKSLEEAHDFKIGVFRGGLTENYLLGKGFDHLVYYTDITNSIHMLERERFDMFSFEPYMLEGFLQLNGYEAGYAVPLIPLEPISTELFYALSIPTNPEVADRLRSAFATLVRNGTFSKIMGAEYHSEFDDL